MDYLLAEISLKMGDPKNIVKEFIKLGVKTKMGAINLLRPIFESKLKGVTSENDNFGALIPSTNKFVEEILKAFPKEEIHLSKDIIKFIKKRNWYKNNYSILDCIVSNIEENIEDAKITSTSKRLLIKKYRQSIHELLKYGFDKKMKIKDYLKNFE